MGRATHLLGVYLLLAANSCGKSGESRDASGAAGATAIGGAAGAVATGGTGGAAPMGGTGGTSTTGAAGAGPIDAGDDGPTGVPDAGTGLEPVTITPGALDATVVYHDLRFVGSGLEQYEGDVVTFRIGSMSGAWRTGYGQIRIVQGAFDVLFPQVVEPGYELKLAHIDADGSGACDAGEPIYIDNALANADITLTFTPSDIRVRAANSGMCDMLNNWKLP